MWQWLGLGGRFVGVRWKVCLRYVLFVTSSHFMVAFAMIRFFNFQIFLTGGASSQGDQEYTVSLVFKKPVQETNDSREGAVLEYGGTFF